MGAPRAAPWSFSKLKAFEQCPKKFHALKVIKTYSEPETDAMMYGTLFHEAAENYVRDGTPLPKSFQFAQDSLDAIKRKEGNLLCEYEMGLTADLEPCKFKDENVWFRGIADLLIVNESKKLAWVIDYKTGKNTRWADKGQLELMALATFKHFPFVEKVNAGLMFVVVDELIKESYLKKDEGKLWEKWLSDFSRMDKAYEIDVWNAHPSGLCRKHCVVTECPHNGNN